LKNNLINLEENILFDDIYNNNNNILHEIFEELLKNDVIYEKNLVSIFEAHNNYIVGFHEKNKAVEADISKMINAINSSYRLSRVNFVWKKKIEQNKENISNQLEGVSQAIADLADEIKKDNEDEFADKREELMRAFQEKKFDIRNLNIKRLKNGRYIIDIYHNLCDDLEGKKCNIKRIKTILERILKDKFIIQHQECGLRESKEQCKFTYMSQDKFSVQIGISKTTKAGSPVSGDTNLETKLEDGKYLLAISDGMGSGPEAMKSSKVAIKTLERLLTAGFDKTMSLKLINSILEITQKDDMYATLDVEILDLYSGIMEFVKNGACPTYLKRNKEVQLLKANTLPAGAIEKMDLEVYDCDLQDGDIIVMCSDGVIESNDEYINKEVWVKYLLEDMQTDDAQKIADILLKEAIDNDYGTQKDDMTVIVAKISKKIR
jgi:protein serine/threonine phosphatase